MSEPHEPTPEQIAAMTALIRMEWDERETNRRLRVDWRSHSPETRRHRATKAEPVTPEGD